MGTGAILVSYAHTEITASTNSNRKTYALGYDYTLNEKGRPLRGL